MCGEGLEVLLMCCQWQMLARNALAITSRDWPVLYLGDDISQLQCHQWEYQGHCLIVFQSVCPSFKVPKLQGKNGEVYVEIYDPLRNYMDPLGPKSLTIIAVRFPSSISRHTNLRYGGQGRLLFKPLSTSTNDWCCDQYLWTNQGVWQPPKKDSRLKKSYFQICTPSGPSSSLMKHAYQLLSPTIVQRQS